MSQEQIIQILLMIPVMLISLSVHEFAHARVAYARGGMPPHAILAA